MIWFLLILGCLLTALLLLPLELEIDSQKQIFEMRWHPILAIGIRPQANWQRYFRLFGWQQTINGNSESATKGKPQKNRKKSKTGMKIRFSRALLWAVFKQTAWALRLRYLRLNWDTDDYLLNAYLFPVFLLASKGERQLRINFRGQQEISLLLYSRLGLLAVAAIRIMFIYKNSNYANKF